MKIGKSFKTESFVLLFFDSAPDWSYGFGGSNTPDISANKAPNKNKKGLIEAAKRKN